MIPTIHFTIISIFDMTLRTQNNFIKDINVTFSQNVLYHMKDYFYRKHQITKKDFSWGGVSQRGSHFCNIPFLEFMNIKFERAAFILY